MMICPQCVGKGSTFLNNKSLETYPGSNTFQTITQQLVNVCNFCLGVGYFTGSGS